MLHRYPPGGCRTTVAIALCLWVVLQVRPDAFGDPGHRVVGHLAERHLDGTRALKEVRRILRPGDTLADASAWPDTIRRATYEDGDTARFRLAHPGHDTYHYTNVPFQAARYDAGSPGAHFTDLVRMSRECIRVLRGRSDVFTPREALRLLAHFAGDIHQPLHVGNAFVSAKGPLVFVTLETPNGWRSTLGGNALRYGPNDTFNLHSYWDAHAVNLAMRKEDPASFAARLARETAPGADWKDTGDVESWPERWASEALPLARDAYAGVMLTEYLGQDADRGTTHRWRIRQRAGYDDLAVPRIRVQLARAGYRLAATLQAIWP